MNVIESVSSNVVRKLSVALGVLLAGSTSVTANPENTEELSGNQAETRVFPADISIDWTYPPSGYISPRIEEVDGSRPPQLSEFFVSFSDPVQLTESMITVQSTGDVKPKVVKLTPDGKEPTGWWIVLDQPVPPARSVWMTFDEDQVVVLSALPGDVNQDGEVSDADLAEFDQTTPQAVPDPLYYDLNSDDGVDLDDRELLSDWLAQGASDDPPGQNAKAICCRENTTKICNTFLVDPEDDCPTGHTEADCPCPDPWS